MSPSKRDLRDKRTRLVDSASRLAYRQGFSDTTLSDVAADASVPLGNVYYYFRTKESLGDAVISQRLEQLRAKLASFDEIDDPRERLQAFVEMTLENRKALARSGCPIGTLCAELRKQDDALGDRAAQLFADTLDWLERQFRVLRVDGRARDQAIHMLSALEGATLLTHSFGDTGYLEREAARVLEWIRSS